MFLHINVWSHQSEYVLNWNVNPRHTDLNMKASQGVLTVGCVILCCSVILLFNEQLSFQYSTQIQYAPKIANLLSISGQGIQLNSRLVLF